MLLLQLQIAVILWFPPAVRAGKRQKTADMPGKRGVLEKSRGRPIWFLHGTPPSPAVEQPFQEPETAAAVQIASPRPSALRHRHNQGPGGGLSNQPPSRLNGPQKTAPLPKTKDARAFSGAPSSRSPDKPTVYTRARYAATPEPGRKRLPAGRLFLALLPGKTYYFTIKKE